MEFCSYFEQIADSPNFLRKLALEFCLRPKSLKLRHSSNWAANLFKIWQNSNASLSVAYLFFIIYLKSIEWTIHKIGKFVEIKIREFSNIPTNRCLFKPFHLLLTNTKIINQYHTTYTLYSGLNHVNYLNIIKSDHVSATVRTRLHLASGWSLDHSGA